MPAIPGTTGVAAGLAIIVSTAGVCAQQTEQLTLPNVTVIAPASPVEAPYLRDPGKAYQRNPYSGRYRVEEDRFREVPCTATRIASAAGGRCLQGYRLLPGATDQITNPKGGSNCDLSLDVVSYSTGNLSIEADTLIFDPYKLTAIGHQTSQFCYVNGNTGYDQEDFQDMNQVTRRGTNWRNLVGDGEDKSIEFSDGPHNCAAVRKAGPKWGGGYVFMMHASICRADTAMLRAEDIAYALGSLQVRQYDPEGNLRPLGR
ncbi:MAG: hypothetical protein WA633_01705 [Stellaceae bacterium]